MKTRIPLGETEDLHLELKSAESLEEPAAIGRQVAAMLNSDGGEVWVGLGEQGGVATEIQAIPSPEKAVDSLLDSLIDRLEPSPLPDEVRLDAVPVSEDMSVIRIRVEAGDRGPYAWLKNGGRYFQRRVGSGTRPMSRQELFTPQLEGHRVREDRREAMTRKLLVERESVQAAARALMWLRIQPIEAMNVDLEARLLRDLLEDPTRTGNRRAGWHFVQVSEAPRLSPGMLSWRCWDAFSVDLHQDGGLVCRAPLASLHFKGEELELWPPALLEYPISAFRLAQAVYRECVIHDDARRPRGQASPETGDNEESSVDVLADIAFFGIRGSKLRGGSMLERHWRGNTIREYPEDEEDLTWPEPLVFRLGELLEEPDRCGFRLIRRVYDAFGYREPEMPREYLRESGRLILPE